MHDNPFYRPESGPRRWAYDVRKLAGPLSKPSGQSSPAAWEGFLAGCHTVLTPDSDTTLLEVYEANGVPTNIPCPHIQYLVLGRGCCYILGQTDPLGKRSYAGQSCSHPQCHLRPCGPKKSKQDIKSVGSHRGVRMEHSSGHTCWLQKFRASQGTWAS